jgi:hypothetical protein
MKRCAISLLILMILVVAGCDAASKAKENPQVSCAEVTDIGQLPAEARAVGVDFVAALHTYDVKRIREVVVADQREVMVREAFNGPNAAPIKMLETPKVTGGARCGEAVKLTVRTSAQYSGGDVQVHMLFLTLRQSGKDWLIEEMAADYDSDGDWSLTGTFDIAVTEADGRQTFRTLRGVQGLFGFIDMPFVAGQGQKYMWHFWGAPEAFVGKPLKVTAANPDGKTIDLFSGILAGANNGAVAHLPSSMTLPSPGLWRLEVRVDDRVIGHIVVQVASAS